MKIKLGLGNLIIWAYDKTAKTITITGAYNWDIDPTSVEVYNNTIGAWMVSNGAATCTSAITTTSTAHPLQTLTLSSVPASSANGDTLSIYCECPDDVAILNALVHILP
jgi:hypothetical protein